MDPFPVSSTLTLDDYRALQRAAQIRALAAPGAARRLLLRLPLLLLMVVVIAGLWLARSDREFGFLAAGILACVLLGVANSLLLARRFRVRPGGNFLGPQRMEFDAAGFRILRQRSESRVAWPQVLDVSFTPAHVFLWSDAIAAWVIPARDLPAGLLPSTAAERLRAFAAAAPRNEPLPPLSSDGIVVPPPALDAPRDATAVPGRPWREIGAALRLLVLLPVDAARLPGSDRAIAWLSLLMLVLWIPLDPLLFEGPLAFAPEAIPGLVFVVAGVLLLAFALARLSRPRVEYRRVLLVSIAALPIAMAGSTLAALTEGWLSYAFILAAAAYATLYFKRALFWLSGAIQTGPLIGSALATLFFVIFLDQNFINPSVWVYTGDEDEEVTRDTSGVDWARLGELQFAQATRVDADLARVTAQRAPGAQGYFVGFAGVGEQRVFAEEIDLAARRLADRFGTRPRELRLVNDARDFEKWPFATEPALRRVLKGLGAAMDADDVLFLALSSHGDEDAALAVSNVGMPPAVLAAEDLARDLRESGIRWRVVIVSACYAGSFVGALEDEHTIVIAASDVDRTSFGCADDRDLTYFGEEFYRDALPKAKSLRDAFETAKRAIAARERAEGIEASQPQASFGKLLEEKLGKWVTPHFPEMGSDPISGSG